MDKKAALIYIYKIMSEETYAGRRLKHEEIAEILEKKYGIKLERKAIGGNLKIINKAGFEISGANSKKGAYLSREFDNSELLFLIECVKSSPSLSVRYANDLIERISRLSAGGISETGLPEDSKNYRYYCQNGEFFLSIDELSRAMQDHKRVSFNVCSINVSENILKTDKPISCSPLKLFMREGVLWLAAVVGRGGFITHRTVRNRTKLPVIRYFRVDLIQNVQILEEPAITKQELSVILLNKSIDRFLFEQSNPASSVNDSIRKVVFLCPKDKIGAVLNTFGKTDTRVDGGCRIEELPPFPLRAIDTASWKIGKLNEQMVRVTVDVTPTDMIEFAFRHGPYIIIQEPIDLKESMIRLLDDMRAIQTSKAFEPKE